MFQCHLKDLFCYTGKPEDFDMRSLLREPHFTYEFRKTSDLMASMRRDSINIIIVLDEYGAVAGILTLRDGFKIQPASAAKPALTLRAGTVVVLEGSATVFSNQKGIETSGDLTIKSAKDKKGYLKIKINSDADPGAYYYGIEIKNNNGTASRKLTVTGHTILEIDSYGTTTSNRNGCLFCSAINNTPPVNEVDPQVGATIPSNTKATLEISDQSVVQLRHASKVAQGFKLKSSERILYLQDNGTDPKLLAKDVEIEICLFFSSGSKSITVLPSAGLPSLSIVLVQNSIASAREVLPEPAWPSNVILRILSAE